MKSFKLFVIIILSIFILDKVVFFALLQIDKRVYTGEGVGKLNHFFLVKDTTKIVFFGSSRANHHINPKAFGKSAFNMGINGRKTGFCATLIQTLPKHKKQFVILQIDARNLYEKDYSGKDINALYVKYHQNKIIRKNINATHNNNYFSPVIWSLDYNGLVLSLVSNFLRPKYNYKKYDGYDPLKNSKDQKQIFLKKIKLGVAPEDCPESYVVAPLEESYINQIQSFCKENGKTLIMFTSPMYANTCPKDNAAMMHYMKQKGITYYDFTDFYKNNNNLDYWKDESHLSKTGAEAFSVYLADFLKKDLK